MYTLSDSAFNLLKHDLKVILDSASHHVTEPTDDKYIRSSNYAVDSRVNPSDFFHCQFQGKYVYLYKTHQGDYTIVCERFIPSQYKSYKSTVDLEIYRNAFGSFEDFESAVLAFVTVCHDMLHYAVSNEVEFNQLELY